jgi:hypothetical protein
MNISQIIAVLRKIAQQQQDTRYEKCEVIAAFHDGGYMVYPLQDATVEQIKLVDEAINEVI